MTPQEARATMARLYEDVCDGIEEQLREVECLQLNEGDYSLGSEDLTEIASIMVHRGYSAQVFRFAKSLGRATLIVGRIVPMKQHTVEVF